MNLRKLVIIMLSVPLLVALSACQKEDDETVFHNERAGNNFPCYDIDIDGATIVVDEGHMPLLHAEYKWDKDNEKGTWDVWGEWVRVHYYVSQKLLMILIDDNDSGAKRTAVVTFMYNGKPRAFRIIQEK